MSDPDPRQAKPESAVRKVLRKLKLSKTGKKPPQQAEFLGDDDREPDNHRDLVFSKLQTLQAELGQINRSALPTDYAKLENRVAILRHQFGVAYQKTEKPKAAIDPTLQARIFRELEKHADALLGDVAALSNQIAVLVKSGGHNAKLRQSGSLEEREFEIEDGDSASEEGHESLSVTAADQNGGQNHETRSQTQTLRGQAGGGSEHEDSVGGRPDSERESEESVGGRPDSERESEESVGGRPDSERESEESVGGRPDSERESEESVGGRPDSERESEESDEGVSDSEEGTSSTEESEDEIPHGGDPNAASSDTAQKSDDVGPLKRRSDLLTEFETLAPLVRQALSLAAHAAKTNQKTQESQVKTQGNQLDLLWKKTESIVGQLYRDDYADSNNSILGANFTKIRELSKQIVGDCPPSTHLEVQKERLGQIVDPQRLTIGDALGRGAFGTVSRLQGPENISLVGKSFPADNPDARKAMEHEAEIYAMLGSHPNIGSCYGVHDIQGQTMLIMETIDGEDFNETSERLAQNCRDQKCTRSEFLGSVQQMMKGILQGLAHFEALGLVHKDIKGDNIKIDKATGKAILIDMGLSQQEGKVSGGAFTPSAPPEYWLQKNDDRFKEPASSLWDTFSLGKVLFPVMETDGTDDKFQFLTGKDAKKAQFASGSHVATLDDSEVRQGIGATVRKDGENRIAIDKKDAHGNLRGLALKKGEGSDGIKPGEFGVETSYVDFMNRLTHPDPAQRLSPLQALKHPFIADPLLDDEQTKRILFPHEGGTENPGRESEAVVNNGARNGGYVQDPELEP